MMAMEQYAPTVGALGSVKDARPRALLDIPIREIGTIPLRLEELGTSWNNATEKRTQRV